jgi:hypothetical protein
VSAFVSKVLLLLNVELAQLGEHRASRASAVPHRREISEAM